jgi:hypothetical protein
MLHSKQLRTVLQKRHSSYHLKQRHQRSQSPTPPMPGSPGTAESSLAIPKQRPDFHDGSTDARDHAAFPQRPYTAASRPNAAPPNASPITSSRHTSMFHRPQTTYVERPRTSHSVKKRSSHFHLHGHGESQGDPQGLGVVNVGENQAIWVERPKSSWGGSKSGKGGEGEKEKEKDGDVKRRVSRMKRVSRFFKEL